MAAASAGITTEHDRGSEHDSRFCNANRLKTSSLCRRPAGWGTDHPGSGRCKLHGGGTPSHRKHSARLIAIGLGDELDMEPNEALLAMLRRAAALHAYWRNTVAMLEPNQVVVEKLREREWSGTGENGGGGGFETVRESHAELHIALRAEREAMQDVVKFAKTALDAGVDERRVQLEEELAAGIGALLRGIYEALVQARELSPAGQRIFREQSGRGLKALEGGQAA